MKLIILPGNSSKNKEWADAAAAYFGPRFGGVYAHYYEHWDTGAEAIDNDVELERLASHVPQDDDYIVIAKSAGTVLCAYGVKKGILSPKRCVFAGFPVGWAQNFKSTAAGLFDGCSVPTDVVQNDADPVSTHAEVAAALARGETGSFALHKIAGSDHSYLDFALIESVIEPIQPL